MKKVLLVLSILLLSCNIFAADHFVSGTVKHYNEFDSTENPNGNYWCGHTALRSIGEYITGNEKSLQSIHNTFWNNSAGYRANDYCYDNGQWCASLQDLMWAAQLSQNNGYDRSNSVVRVIGWNDYSHFLTKVKDGVINNLPPIVASKWYYNNAGHFWIITGYKDSTTGNDEDTYIYLRDVSLSSPIYTKYDRKVKIKEFLNETNIYWYDSNGNQKQTYAQFLYIK
jgi:hypothetical protein